MWGRAISNETIGKLSELLNRGRIAKWIDQADQSQGDEVGWVLEPAPGDHYFLMRRQEDAIELLFYAVLQTSPLQSSPVGGQHAALHVDINPRILMLLSCGRRNITRESNCEVHFRSFFGKRSRVVSRYHCRVDCWSCVFNRFQRIKHLQEIA